MEDLNNLASALSGLSLAQAAEVAAGVGRTVPEVFDYTLALALEELAAACSTQIPSSANEILDSVATALDAVHMKQLPMSMGPVVCETIAIVSESAHRLSAAVQYHDSGVTSTPSTYLLSPCASGIAMSLCMFAKRSASVSDVNGQAAACGSIARLLASAASDCVEDVKMVASSHFHDK